ncbi:hypothetical protein BH748_01810 [Enterococcus casseliflavus]|uniref:DUF7006 family protein n=1 Tax=Enterococcus casseliflavus TaxID=37734 RepID=UPI0009BE9C8B|nr:hypothetical protein [Enterococcus casseliflavus]OQO87980.1 hypothetical protein BH748_01810 [Enterococcus casseliflavus]
MKLKTIRSAEQYLNFFDDEFIHSFCSYEYPKIHEFYLSLRERFLDIYEQSDDNFFEKMSSLLDIDAQLQILRELYVLKNSSLNEYTEEEIIKLTINDKKCFYRELTGLNLSQKAPWSVIYLSELQ